MLRTALMCTVLALASLTPTDAKADLPAEPIEALARIGKLASAPSDNEGGNSPYLTEDNIRDILVLDPVMRDLHSGQTVLWGTLKFPYDEGWYEEIWLLSTLSYDNKVQIVMYINDSDPDIMSKIAAVIPASWIKGNSIWLDSPDCEDADLACHQALIDRLFQTLPVYDDNFSYIEFGSWGECQIPTQTEQ